MGENIPQMANGTAKASKVGKRKLWTHPDPGSTRMAEFMHCVNQKYGLRLKTYEDLYRWSIDDIGSFWGDAWDFTGITASKQYEDVCQCVDHVIPVLPLELLVDSPLGCFQIRPLIPSTGLLPWISSKLRRESAVPCKRQH